jgi:hypothetical protein
MGTLQEQLSKLPLGLKIAVAYLLFAGASSFLFPLFGLGPNYAEFDAKSTAYKVSVYTQSAIVDGLFVVAGIGLFYRRSWARKLGLIILVVSTVYGAYEFAWGVAHGRPSSTLVLIGFVVVGAWNAIWFSLVYRRSSAQCLS